MVSARTPDTNRSSGRALALIPITVAVVLAALLLPRSVPPTDVPLPLADGRVIARIEREDDRRATEARGRPLPAEDRALGSAVRELNALSVRYDFTARELGEARHRVDTALAIALEATGVEGVLTLRAVQLDAFLAEARAFERTGEASAALTELGGKFVPTMRRAGWIVEHAIRMPEEVRRVAFKLSWNALVGVEARKELAPVLDEQRLLYAFYLAHPHASDSAREAIATARHTAKTADRCAALAAGERVAEETWRIDKIKRLAAIDSSYPTSFALGVAHYRAGSYGAAADAFRDWLRSHPEGELALRARNHLRAAVSEDALAP